MNHPYDPTQIHSSIVRKMHASHVVGLSTTRVEALIRAGKFPAPFKICEGGRASGWLRSTLDDWVAQRANTAATRQCHNADAVQDGQQK